MTACDKDIDFVINHGKRDMTLDLMIFDLLDNGIGVNALSQNGYDYILDVAWDAADASAHMGCKGVVITGHSPWHINLVY